MSSSKPRVASEIRYSSNARSRLPEWVAGLAAGWPAWAAVLGLFLLWEGACRLFEIPEFLLPAPSAIWAETSDAWVAVGGHSLATLSTVLMGFAASVVISLPLAMLIASSPAISAAIYPLLIVTQSIPKVALAPILVVALGPTELPRVIVTFLVAFFPLVVGTVAGLLAAPPELIELGRASRATRIQELLRIRLPFAVPFVFSGLKVAAALSVVGAVVAEFVGADAGLGYLIQSAMAFFRTPLAFGAVVILAILGILLFQVVALVERVFFPWSSGAERPVGGV